MSVLGVQNVPKIVFVSGLFPGYLFTDFLIEISNCKNHIFMEDVFHKCLSRFVSFFKCLGSCFSSFVGLQNRLENEGIFSDVMDAEKWIWGRRSTIDLSPLKT